MDSIVEEQEVAPRPEEFVPQKIYLEADASFGEVREMTKGAAEIWFSTTRSMMVDGMGLVHSGFIFSSANFAALCAVNNPNAILLGADVKFLAPIEVGHDIEFRAHSLQSDTKKREVRVEGYVLDIKVFEAMFYVAIFENHIFKLRITEKKPH